MSAAGVSATSSKNLRVDKDREEGFGGGGG
jgi:hypothetical protein